MGVALLFVPVYGLFCFEWVNLYQEGVKIKQQMELVGWIKIFDDLGMNWNGMELKVCVREWVRVVFFFF